MVIFWHNLKMNMPDQNAQTNTTTPTQALSQSDLLDEIVKARLLAGHMLLYLSGRGYHQKEADERLEIERECNDFLSSNTKLNDDDE